MEIKLNEDERIDDLQLNGLKIIQNPNWFCFGIDSVLLSDFAKDLKKDSLVLDLGTGTGIIPILLCGKTQLKKVVGVEVQEDVFNITKRNIVLNNLKDKFEVINDNINNLDKYFNKNKFDVIITNPPYKKKGDGVKNEIVQRLISRHEILATLEDFIRISSDFLKDKGNFYMVHKVERLADIMVYMRKYKIEPKRLRLVFSNIESKPILVLINGIKNAKPFLKIDSNIYIYDKDGNYTNQIKEIYSENRGSLNGK